MCCNSALSPYDKLPTPCSHHSSSSRNETYGERWAHFLPADLWCILSVKFTTPSGKQYRTYVRWIWSKNEKIRPVALCYFFKHFFLGKWLHSLKRLYHILAILRRGINQGTQDADWVVVKTTETKTRSWPRLECAYTEHLRGWYQAKNKIKAEQDWVKTRQRPDKPAEARQRQVA